MTGSFPPFSFPFGLAGFGTFRSSFFLDIFLLSFLELAPVFSSVVGLALSFSYKSSDRDGDGISRLTWSSTG